MTTDGSADATAAANAYAAELAALKSSIEAQKSEIESQRAEITDLITNAQSVKEATANAARAAAGQNALAAITAAIASGASYSEQIKALQDAGISDLPDGLTAAAADGVPTLASLQASFPDTAREALGASRRAGSSGEEGGVGSFLRRQLNARSVVPRDGDDPDAVLSRAEDAVRNGNIAAAVSEMDGLPADAQTAADAWLRDARTRAAAEAAVKDLTERLTAN